MSPPTPQDASASCRLVENVMAVLGRAWAGAVIEAMLAGNVRFSAIARAVGGATDGVISTRLKELAAHGLVEREVDPGPPVAVRYRLTEAGQDVAPVLAAVRGYGLRHPEVGA